MEDTASPETGLLRGGTKQQERRNHRKKDASSKSEVKNLTIHLLNIQGLTRAKQIEIEELARREGEIICLTETQQKIDRIHLSEGIGKVERRRDMKDKKGGGLLIAYKMNSLIKVEKVETVSPDILYATVSLFSTVLHVLLVYLSVNTTTEDKVRNQKIKKELESILERVEEIDGASLVLGDFNGHIAGLGYQRQNENGNIAVDLTNNFGLTLLNLDEACKGIYTWTRQEQKSAIDFVMANKSCYELFQRLVIDEEREILDISDHNVLTTVLKVRSSNVDFKKGDKMITKTYFKTDEKSLEIFAVVMQEKLSMKEVKSFEELNELMKEVADTTLKAIYQRRESKKHQVTEQPWITDQIRREIKKRRELNRRRRNTQSETETQNLRQEYLKQKHKVQGLIKEAITVSEKKLTNEIRASKNRSRAIWENINKLRRERTQEAGRRSSYTRW